MKLWIGFGSSVIFLTLFFLTVDIAQMLDAISGANYWYTVPAIVLYLFSVLFRTIRWKNLLSHMKNISISRLYPVVIVGYMANNMLPLRLGELVRSYYVSEREGISKTSALVTILIERLMDALTLLLFVATMAIFVPLPELANGLGKAFGIPWPLLIASMSLPFILTFCILMLAARYPRRSRQLATLFIKRIPARLAERIKNIIHMIINGLTALHRPKTILNLFVLSAPIWLFESGLFLVIGFSFGLEEVYGGFWKLVVAIVLVTAIANIGSSIPAAPGGIGLFELIARETMVLLPLSSVDRAVASGYVAVVHASLLLPVIFLGQIFLWTQHLSLRHLVHIGQSDQE